MRLPRVRLKLRGMLVLVAAVALGLAVVVEFSDGLPPRFVLRGVPGRVARLRPGMSWAETHEILGLEKSWLLGGSGAQYAGGYGNRCWNQEEYCIRPPRIVIVRGSLRGGPMLPTEVYRSSGMLCLSFSHDPEVRDWRRHKSTRLIRAAYYEDARTVAEVESPPRIVERARVVATDRPPDP